jgi:hypothetical protein
MAAVTNDLDMTFVSTQEWIRSIGYPIVSDWRPHDAVAGSVSLLGVSTFQ